MLISGWVLFISWVVVGCICDFQSTVVIIFSGAECIRYSVGLNFAMAVTFPTDVQFCDVFSIKLAFVMVCVAAITAIVFMAIDYPVSIFIVTPGLLFV